MKIKKVLSFILVCAIIAVILPIGYFVIGVLFLGNTPLAAFKDSALTFAIMFVITVIGLLLNKD